MRNAGLEEAQGGIKIAGRNINNLRDADDTTLMAENEELRSLLMTVKKESEKFGLKLNVQKTKIMASNPITSWQIEGETLFSTLRLPPVLLPNTVFLNGALLFAHCSAFSQKLTWSGELYWLFFINLLSKVMN